MLARCAFYGVMFFAYLFNIYGISVIDASAIGSCIYIQPIFAAIIAMIFTCETYDWLNYLLLY